ncbi:MAG: hypothetical protein FJ279_24400 [Planctomycetes bacterium]|nr:hypothetical protein [Planctomycetota bacterium]
MTGHEARGGARCLGVLNRNVDKAVTDAVTLSGDFKRGIDLDAPGGFPLAFKAPNGETSFALRLEPAEFTVVALEK